MDSFAKSSQKQNVLLSCYLYILSYYFFISRNLYFLARPAAHFLFSSLVTKTQQLNLEIIIKNQQLWIFVPLVHSVFPFTPFLNLWPNSKFNSFPTLNWIEWMIQKRIWITIFHVFLAEIHKFKFTRKVNLDTIGIHFQKGKIL